MTRMLRNADLRRFFHENPRCAASVFQTTILNSWETYEVYKTWVAADSLLKFLGNGSEAHSITR